MSRKPELVILEYPGLAMRILLLESQLAFAVEQARVARIHYDPSNPKTKAEVADDAAS